MIPSLIGILVSLTGLVLIYLGVHGHSSLLAVYPVTVVKTP